jgi:hypothetical protein
MLCPLLIYFGNRQYLAPAYMISKFEQRPDFKPVLTNHSNRLHAVVWKSLAVGMR